MTQQQQQPTEAVQPPAEATPAAPVEEQPETPFDMAAFEASILADLGQTADPQPVAPVVPPVPPAAPVVPAAAPVAQTPAQAPQSQGNPFDDGFTWNSEVEAYKDLDAAINTLQPDGTVDVSKFAKVNQAIIHRNIIGTVSPLVAKIEALERELAEIRPVKEYVPRLQEQDNQARLARNEEIVRTELTKAVPQLAELLKPPADGSTVLVNGIPVPATGINKILADFPYILNIQVNEPHPDRRQRLELAKIYNEAYRLHTRLNGSMRPVKVPAAAPPAVAAPPAQQRQVQQEAVQVAINAPGSAPPPAAPEDFVQQLIRNVPSAGDIFRSS